jgi:polar amino acid transport system substrate-binding protein
LSCWHCSWSRAPSPAAPGASTSAGDLKGRTLKVGSDTTYPPFEFVDKKTNAVVGYDVDLVNEVCKAVNCKATFVTTNFDTIFVVVAEAIRSRCFGVTITDERKKAVDFGDPYLHYEEILLVR